ncbi:type IV secretion system protein [Bartonella sp. B30(2025)]
MKKLIISMVIATILGTPSTAFAFTWWGGAGMADLERSTPNSSWFFGKAPSKKATKPTPPKKTSLPNNTELVDLIKKHIRLKEQGLAKTEEMYKSITGNRSVGLAKMKRADFLLENPQSIYDESKNSDISNVRVLLAKILNEEKISDSVRNARESIGERSQYAAVIDKAVSLHAFDNTEKRFQQILGLLEEISVAKDLKSIAELQARFKARLAMIQNEATKLQMVAHMRNAERELISQQKLKRNMKILNSSNTEMPTIRSIR